jgi:hypothetical protein
MKAELILGASQGSRDHDRAPRHATPKIIGMVARWGSELRCDGDGGADPIKNGEPGPHDMTAGRATIRRGGREPNVNPAYLIYLAFSRTRVPQASAREGGNWAPELLFSTGRLCR